MLVELFIPPGDRSSNERPSGGLLKELSLRSAALRDRLIALSSTNKQDGNLTAMQILAQKMNQTEWPADQLSGSSPVSKEVSSPEALKRVADLQNDLWNFALTNFAILAANLDVGSLINKVTGTLAVVSAQLRAAENVDRPHRRLSAVADKLRGTNPVTPPGPQFGGRPPNLAGNTPP